MLFRSNISKPSRLKTSALIASDEIISPMTAEVFSLDGLEIFIEELSKLQKNLRTKVEHSRIIINSFDNRIKQHRDIFLAASEGKFTVYKIPVDPLFRKAQEAGSAPQHFRKRGKGLKPTTLEAIKKINLEIWR